MPRILHEMDHVGTNYVLSTLSIIAVFFAIYIIISKNPILSVLFLIGLFFSISVYLITIGLHFLGLVYLIVYVGAVSILFLFILMLINVRVSELLSDSRNSVPLAIISILCFNYSVNDILPYSIYIYDTFNINNLKLLGDYITNIIPLQVLNSSNDIFTSILYYLLYVNITSVTSKSWDAIMVTSSHITSIGNILYTNLFILFLITSLILLLAMVGAIIITINKNKTNNEFALNLTSPVKAHAFINLPLHANILSGFGNFILGLKKNILSEDIVIKLKPSTFNNRDKFNSVIKNHIDENGRYIVKMTVKYSLFSSAPSVKFIYDYPGKKDFGRSPYNYIIKLINRISKRRYIYDMEVIYIKLRFTNRVCN